jgi:hypothetical protein
MTPPRAAVPTIELSSALFPRQQARIDGFGLILPGITIDPSSQVRDTRRDLDPVLKNGDDLKFKFDQQLDKLLALRFIEFNLDKELANAAPAVHIEATITDSVAGVVGAHNR